MVYFTNFPSHCPVHNVWKLHRMQGRNLVQLIFRLQVVVPILQTDKDEKKLSLSSNLENIGRMYDSTNCFITSQSNQTCCSVSQDSENQVSEF